MIISTLFTTIAYAGLSTRLSITSEADIRVPADIRITRLSTGGLNGNSTNYTPRYSKDTVTMGFNIGAGSTINYNVTVSNSGDIDQTIYEITTVSTNNANVTCATTGYNVKEIIGYRDSVTFGITCTSTVSASNVNIVLRFNFKKVYHITYDANTGTNAPSEQLKYEDVDLVLTEDEPEKIGYNFLGWADSSSATTAQYEPGDTYTLNSDKILYAVWKEDKHTVIFDYATNGGTSSTETSVELRSGDNVVFPTATKSGYKFEGWSKDADSHEVLTSLTIEKADDSTITFYASYSYTVTWSANSGSAPAKTSETKNAYMVYTGSKAGVAFAMPAATTRNYYDFAGWGASKYAASSSQTFSSNQSLPAQWTAKSYTITLDPKFYNGTSTTVLVTPSTQGTTSITSKYNTSLSPTSISRPYTSTIAATNGTIYLPEALSL